jgi:hypothetical protein
MIILPDNKTISDGYAPHKFIHGFVKHWEDLRDEWPNESLFKDEGHVKPRKHGQRPHLRKFMCYSPWPDSPYFDQYKIQRYQLSETWDYFVDKIFSSKEYSDWLKETLEIPGNNFKYRFDWHVTQGGQDVSPHVDSAGKLGSHLIYFMPEGWNDSCGGQTVFYKGKLVENLNPEFSDFKEHVSYSNVGNTSLLFKNVEEGWHGVTEVNSDLNRQIFNVVILKND